MAKQCWFVAVLCSLVSAVNSLEMQRTCEPIWIETCKDIGYNVTGMPNLVGHDLQQDAQLQLQTFRPLIQYGCSSRLKFFLCSVYVPMCTEKVAQPIGPCRTLCKAVKSRCQPVLQEFGFPWPSGLSCNNFPPENNDKHMCMDGPEADNFEKEPYVGRTKEAKATISVLKNAKKRHFGLCGGYRKSNVFYYVNRTSQCSQLCTADVLFNQEDKNFVEIWITIWAVLCFVSTLFTAITFIVDRCSYKYPEFAIIILSITYNVYSIAYIIRINLGRAAVACNRDSQHNVTLLTVESLDNINCTIVFMLLYYFGMASMIWWVILTITWYLSEALRWTQEAIQQYYTFFHLAAWFLPAAKTIAILVLRLVDADELTGICYVGNRNNEALLGFVISPNLVYLFIGIMFLTAGVIAIYRMKRVANHSLNNRKKLKIRIGIFALLYIIPATCVLAANIYEYSFRDQWLTANVPLKLTFEVFTLKIFMSFIIGITTGLWIWSSKSPICTWNVMRERFKFQKSTNSQIVANKLSCQRYLIIQENCKRHQRKPGNETAV